MTIHKVINPSIILVLSIGKAVSKGNVASAETVSLPLAFSHGSKKRDVADTKLLAAA